MKKPIDIHAHSYSLTPVADIMRHERNARAHSPKQIKKLAAAIRKFGFTQPLVIDAGKVLLAGHGRYEAALLLGMEKVPTITLPLAGDEARAFMLADNRLAELSSWDTAKLAEEIEDLRGTFSAADMTELDFGDMFNVGAPVVPSTEWVAIDELRPHPRNYREHPPEQIEHIVASIKANGLYRNAIIASDGTILAGHGMVQALRSIGSPRVPCLRLSIPPTDQRALRIMMGDNEIARGGESDDRQMTTILAEVLDSDDGLLGTGFTDDQLRALLYLTHPEGEAGPEPSEPREAHPGAGEYTLKIRFETEHDRDLFTETLQLNVDKKGAREWIARPAD
jgi:ParB-like chromosome segregation protein Spo0J